MKTLLAALLAAGLVVGSASFAKADVSKGGGGRVPGLRSQKQFSSWEAKERDRIQEAYRYQRITEPELNSLNQELSKIDSLRDRALQGGQVSRKDGKRLHGMEARLDREAATAGL